MPEPRDQTQRAIWTLLASVTAMAFADAMVKFVSAELSIWQLFTVRSLCALPVMVLITRMAALRRALRAPAVWARSVLLVLCWLAYYAALPWLELSVAAVAVYTNPILTTVLAAVWLREPVTGRQAAGVVIGFVGVLVIIKPGTGAVSAAALLPFLAAALYSVAMITTRAHCQGQHPLAMGTALHLAFVLAGVIGLVGLAPLLSALGSTPGSAFLTGGWAPLSGANWAILAGLGLLAAAYFSGVAYAYQSAPPQRLATFDYAYLVSAALWGAALFAEVPSISTVLGMALITVAGLLVASTAPGAAEAR
ncbi:MAG: DMT family transporter [Pseudomonadota bacterium]